MRNQPFTVCMSTHMPINFSGARDLMMSLGCPEMVPMEMLARHPQQVYKNHRQGLTLLAPHGGLCVSEICAIMEDRPWKRQTPQECTASLLTHLLDFAYARTSECRESIAQAEAHIADLKLEIEHLSQCYLKTSNQPVFQLPFPTVTARSTTLDVKFEFSILMLQHGEPPDPFGVELLPVSPKVGETITLHYQDGRIAGQAIVRGVQGSTLFVEDLRCAIPSETIEEQKT